MFDEFEKPRVTVIIPSLANSITRPHLKLTVESLRKTVDWDIIVVTNGSNEKPNLDDIYGISQHAHTAQQGQCRSVNIGAAMANAMTQYFFIINDDMYFAPGWNENIPDNGNDWPLVWSPNLVEPDDNPGSAEPFLKLGGDGFTLDKFDIEKVNSFISEKVKSEKGVSEDGFNFPLFIRKDVWNTIGGYDILYDPWGSNSDTDLQTKIALAGITPVRRRDVLVYHFSNKSGTFDGTHQTEWQRNWDYFDRKWGFNRDVLKSDVWYHSKMLPKDPEQIKYKPWWKDKYAPKV